MHHKTLGRTGLSVPVVGLGAAFIGVPDPSRAVDEYSGKPGQMNQDLGVATVVAAMDAGCTLIDTAALYGRRISETIIGKALKERPALRDSVVVTTKVGRLSEGQDYSYDAILRSVEESQRLLGMERFEIVYIHDAMEAPVENVMGADGALGALRKLQDEGIVGYVGSAMNDPECNADYIETGEFDAAVVPDAWSLLNQHALERILPAAEKHNVGLVVATPLERGLLATGPMPDIDYLARDFSQRCLDHVTKIQGVCKNHGVSMAAVALQWCARDPRVATTIPGARTPDEATSNMEAGSEDIPDALWTDLEPLVTHFEHGVDR